MPTILIKPKSFSQLGAALIISMIMLLAVTAIGVAVMGGSHLELLMSNNSYFQTDAYRNAEIALKQGLNNLPTTINKLGPADPNDISTWSSGPFGTPVTTPTGTGRYAVEYVGHNLYTISPFHYVNSATSCLGPNAMTFCVNMYHVWGYGTDGKGAKRLLLETYSASNALPSWRSITEIQ